jgi:TatD DNase family protein
MIDFHTHHRGDPKNTIVQSIPYTDLDGMRNGEFYTIGIHPWETDRENIDIALHQIIEYAQHPEVIGIGEVGLDRLRGANLNRQIEIFVKQICIVDQIRKPLIIHCVRAWAELLEIKKMSKSMVAWAIHGFRGTPELARQLIDRGMYLSFGAQLVEAAPSLAEAITTVPLDRLFLETDESHTPVEEIYYAASDILNISMETLADQIRSNFQRFFSLPL